MFKQLSRGRRSARGGGQTVRRVSASQLNKVSASPGPQRPAFLPDTPQEQGQDSNSPRLSGLEK